MIILGISGSIAAYKSIDLAKSFIEKGYDVKIVLSSSAEDFISPLSLRSLFPNKVYLHNEALGPQDEMLHISLAKEADLILIAPASANTIAKLANGYADCLLSTICLASEAPIMLAPAMNKIMWENKFVQNNIAKFKHIIGPASGKQACGDDGFGRMLEPEEIIEHVQNFYTYKSLQNKKIIITAGPTIERIDPVRFISNDSSGKMGYALAKMALRMGADVTLISGPCALTPPNGVNLVKVTSANEMLEATLEHAKNQDILIASAAVADYKPMTYEEDKLKKLSKNLNIQMTLNPDILASIKQKFPHIFAVGFAAETSNFKEYGIKKITDKKIDMIAINDVSNDQVFGKDHNELHVITKDKKEHFIKRNTKDNIAQSLLEFITL